MAWPKLGREPPIYGPAPPGPLVGDPNDEDMIVDFHGSYINNLPNSQKMKALLHYQRWNNIEVKQENGKCLQDKPPKNHENKCYGCGMKGHWSRTCRTLKHLVDLYQTSIKEKEIEMNNYVPRRYIIFLILLYN